MNDQLPKTSKKKLVVGWFSFTCCEGCLILFTELLNDLYDDWSKLVEFRHLKALKMKNELRDLDVAFVEGAISSDSQVEEVKKIRANSKYVVAIGSCACNGRPSASRNDFKEEELTYRIQWYYEHFHYGDKVKKLEEIIKVDDKVDGCPMNAAVFKQAATKYLQLFKLV
ncbi:hypothetical protein GYA49_03150 [Candidatus Beckwithbacteria bacterium]|nr:hypothetical protein [Candidatus Beckwithbacteria bacterium]